jgi:ABC-type amino acid transport substrate-binding protein
VRRPNITKKSLVAAAGAVAILAAVSGCSANSSASSSSTTASHSYDSELVQKGVLTVATTATAPPLTNTDSSGKLVGFWPEVATELGKRLGLKTQFKQIAWDGLLPGVTSHKYDLGDGGILQTAERKASDQFILSTPLLQGGVVMVVKKGSDISSWKDVKGQPVGGTSGETEYQEGQDYLKSKNWAPSGYTTVSGHTDGILALKSGRIKAFIMEASAAQYLVKQDSSIQLAGTVIDKELQGTVYSPKETKLAKAANKAIEGMVKDGYLAKESKKWYGSTSIAYDGSN